nr:tetraspanin family protein [Maliibacterium massiliense]
MHEQQTPMQPAPQEGTKRTRRVGTLTLGVSLIAVGVLALCALLIPHFDFTAVARYAPVLLILLGVEVLVSALLFRRDTIKYDVASGLICLLLVVVTCSVGAVSQAWSYFGTTPQRTRVEHRLRQELEQAYFDKLQGDARVKAIQVRVHTAGRALQQDMPYSALEQADHVSVEVALMGPYTQKEAFAQDCAQLLSGMAQLNVPLDSVRFSYNEPGATDMEVRVSDTFQRNMDAAQLEKLVDVTIPDGD